MRCNEVKCNKTNQGMAILFLSEGFQLKRWKVLILIQHFQSAVSAISPGDPGAHYSLRSTTWKYQVISPALPVCFLRQPNILGNIFPSLCITNRRFKENWLVLENSHSWWQSWMKILFLSLNRICTQFHELNNVLRIQKQTICSPPTPPTWNTFHLLYFLFFSGWIWQGKPVPYSRCQPCQLPGHSDSLCVQPWSCARQWIWVLGEPKWESVGWTSTGVLLFLLQGNSQWKTTGSII